MIEIGSIVGPYEVVGRLGAGGMGEVFRARDRVLGREVALKAVARELATHPSRAARLRREARMLAALNHPGIAAIYGLEEAHGVPVLVLELVPGTTLGDRIRQGPLPMAEAARLAGEIADGLAAAHAAGIVHRDLKPANIRLTPEGRIKLLDFGLAKALLPLDDDGDLADEPTASLTAEGAVFGTTPFMSPEQVRGVDVDRRMDVWAFGCVLYEMLARRRAFRTVAATLEADPDWTALPADTPRALRDLLRRCLDKDPKRRLDNLADARAILEAVASGRVRDSRHRAALVALAAVAATLAIGVTLWLTIPWTGLVSRIRAAAVGPTAHTERTGRSLAVLPFADLSRHADDAWIGTALREMVSAEIERTSDLRFIPGESVARMQRDLELPAAESFTIDTLTRIRTNLNADLVVSGDYLSDAGQIRIDLRVQDSRNGKLVASASDVGDSNDLIGIVARMGEAVRTALHVAPQDDRRAGARAAVPDGEAAMRFYAEGLAAARAYQAWKARPLFEQAVAADPQSPLAQVALATTYRTLGDVRGAAESARQALALDAQLPLVERWWVEGQAEMAAGDPAKAADVFQRLVARDPGNVEYGLALLDALAAAARPSAFTIILEKLRRLPPPAGTDPRLDIAEAEWMLGRDEYRRAQASASRGAELADARGARALVARARLDEARASLELDPARAVLAARDAQRHFEAIGDRAGVAHALLALADTDEHRGDHDGARQLCEDALRMVTAIDVPRLQADAFEALAGTEYELAEPAAARRHHESALAIWREIGPAAKAGASLHNLADVLQELGDVRGAEAAERESLANREPGAPSRAFSFEGLARVQAARGDLDGALHAEAEAADMLERGGSMTSAWTARLSRAMFFMDAGRLGDAAREARLAAAALPSQSAERALALAVLADALTRQGRRSEALPLAHQSALLLADTTRLLLTFKAAPYLAHVQAASSAGPDLAKARTMLADDIAFSAARHLVAINLRLRLALGEIDRLEPRTVARGRNGLLKVRAEARSRGFTTVATLADRLAADTTTR